VKTIIVHNVPYGAKVLIAKERKVSLAPGVYINNAMDGYRDIPDEDIIEQFVHRTAQKGSTLYFYFEEDTYLRIRREGYLSIDLHTSSMEEDTKELEMSSVGYLTGTVWDHPVNDYPVGAGWNHPVNDYPVVNMGVDPALHGRDYTAVYDINVPVRNRPMTPIIDFPLEGTIILTNPCATITHTGRLEIG
jgi:hypothetical protein